GAVRKCMLVARLPAMLFVCGHFAEGAFVTIRLEHRVIAETEAAAWWPDKMAVNLAAKIFGFAIGKTKAKDRNEIRAALGRLSSALILQALFNRGHCNAEIARSIGQGCPVGRVDTGSAIERFDTQAGIIREGRQAGR